MVHGLEGSSAAGYARSLAQAALEAGYAVHRYNMRSCGGTEHFSGTTLYHSGQTSDLLAVIRQLHGQSPIFLAGFSLGGNVVLKLAGELGQSARRTTTTPRNPRNSFWIAFAFKHFWCRPRTIP